MTQLEQKQAKMRAARRGRANNGNGGIEIRIAALDERSQLVLLRLKPLLRLHELRELIAVYEGGVHNAPQQLSIAEVEEWWAARGIGRYKSAKERKPVARDIKLWAGRLSLSREDIAASPRARGW